MCRVCFDRGAGYADDEIASFYKIYRQNNYNIDKTVSAIESAYTTGFRDVFASGEWIPENVYKVIDNYKLNTEFQTILKTAESMDDFVARTKALFQEQRDLAKLTHTQATFPDMDDLKREWKLAQILLNEPRSSLDTFI